MDTLRIILLLTTVAVLLLPAVAVADGSAGCTFCGTVNLDGSEVPAGTLITAVIDGDEYHTHTPPDGSSSTYCITIRPPTGKSYADGTTVVFKVDRQNVAQSGGYQAGANIRLDLSNQGGSASAGVSSGVTSWLTAILVILIAIMCVEIFFLLRKRRLGAAGGAALPVSKPVGKQPTPPQAGSSTPASQESVETRPRYVWDSETLSWVPRGKSADKPGENR